MGLFTRAPAQAGTRLRDDYGAVPAARTHQLTPTRSVPVMSAAIGGQNNVA